MPSAVTRSQEENELHAVLNSRAFSKSPHLVKLLSYLCAKYWEGTSGELKEYRIAVEVLGRSPDFDPLTNSTVRVELHRLRQKLRQFYESEGRGKKIAISLSAGSYIPTFTRSLETAPAGHRAAEAQGHNARNGQPTVTGAPANLITGRAPHPIGRRKNILVLAGGAVIAVLVFLAARHALERRASPAVTHGAPTAANAPPSQFDTATRILAGYAKRTYIDRQGEVWTGDRDYDGGTTGTQFFDRPVSRTLDPTLYQTYRTGNFSYDIPLKHMPYEVRLYFMETQFGPGTLAGGGEASRIFDVKFNGKVVLQDFDPYTDAGGNFIADVRAFKNVMPGPDGYLHIQFTGVKNKPFVNAIEVLPDQGGKLLPIRIVTQENTFTDAQGRQWEPDCYFHDGQLAANRVRVTGTRDSGLYAGERYGNFSYAIPVAPGRYAVTLRFAETFFGSNNPGHGGVGSRVFNVFCNGHTLLQNFDILKEAGGANRALVRTFSGIEPNAQGKILLRFVPVKNYALVNSIEVVDKTR